MTFKTLSFTNPISGHGRHGIHFALQAPSAVMVIIHGFGEHSGRYTHMMEHFGDNGIATIALDLEGHGQSKGKRGVCKTYDILHADIELLLTHANQTYPDLPVILFGHSMGGGLVLHHGLTRNPMIAGTIASAPLIKPKDPVPTVLRFVVETLRPLLPSMTIKNAISGDQISTLPEQQAIYENDPLMHDRLGLGLAQDIIEAGELIEARAADWTEPLLLMHARGDQLTDFEASEKFAATAQTCTYVPFEDCEHEMHQDKTREAAYKAMLDFIQLHAKPYTVL